MLIQPPVQSATQVATFVNSMSATGVEQPVVRAGIMPVDESKPDAAAQNPLRNFQLEDRSSSAGNAGAEKDATASGEARQKDSTQTPSPKTDAAREQEQVEADRVVIEQLKARDREVRLHEAAHAAVGGQYAGSPSLQYTRGPDGKNYATGGEVGISTSPVSGDPQATIEKARVIRAAALAPAQPSAQDRRVAAEAAQMEVEARTDLLAMEAQEQMAAEKARADQREEEKARKLAEEETAEPVEEDAAVEDPKPEKPVIQVAAPAVNQEEEGARADEEAEEEPVEEPRPNARQQLEKILLGSRGLLVDANRLGLVDPRNPFGESGYLDVLA